MPHQEKNKNRKKCQHKVYRVPTQGHRDTGVGKYFPRKCHYQGLIRTSSRALRGKGKKEEKLSEFLITWNTLKNKTEKEKGERARGRGKGKGVEEENFPFWLWPALFRDSVAFGFFFVRREWNAPKSRGQQNPAQLLRKITESRFFFGSWPAGFQKHAKLMQQKFLGEHNQQMVDLIDYLLGKKMSEILCLLQSCTHLIWPRVFCSRNKWRMIFFARKIFLMKTKTWG